MNTTEIAQEKIILFDGVCNPCNDSVIFILQNEQKPVFKFASIQSGTGKELLRWCGLAEDYSEAVVFIDNGMVYLGSTAALKIGQSLKLPWSIVSQAGLIVPKFVRSWVYHQIGRHRYQWFGRREVCMVPTEILKARFL